MPNRNTVIAQEYTYGDDFRRVKDVEINELRNIMIAIADAKMDFVEANATEPTRLFLTYKQYGFVVKAARKKLLNYTVDGKDTPTHFTGMEIRRTKKANLYVDAK